MSSPRLRCAKEQIFRDHSQTHGTLALKRILLHVFTYKNVNDENTSRLSKFKIFQQKMPSRFAWFLYLPRPVQHPLVLVMVDGSHSPEPLEFM